ncbi:leucine-rich repeat domain-containing protein [Niastella caeni]|uniref:Leucine-rich repeat domain-containing protein n=1 Tax=Niastella caeni TaxID=2569763 RepID=A0A4S8HSV7_9BACT|nr:leucine-rich repeat domain-containing protein [Niastella caeni]THU38375.1 leucine-rich repeat domain-containing protein [Niastella caeni]
MTQYKIITEKEAIARYQLSKYIQGKHGDKAKYVLLEGNVEITQDVNIQKFCSAAGANGIIVDGNLTLTGILYQPDMDYGETLFVTGNLHAKSVNKGGAEFYIKGNLVVEQTIYGYYNHGSLVVEGNTEATTIFAEDHYFKFGGDVQGLIISTGQIEGVEVDFHTTEPLLDELIKNDHYSNSGKLDQYINEGRHIISAQYLAGRKQRVSFDPANTTSAIPKLISNDEAQQRFDLDQYDPFGDMGFEKVILLDGDTYINGDLNIEWTNNTLATLGAKADTDSTLVLVNGNLTVAGTIKPSTESFPFLLVLGNVQCDVLTSYDECIHITGDADITFAFDGNYNDGSITIEGVTRVPYVLNSDHSSSIRPEGAVLINYYSDHDDFFEYDYTTKDFERVMVSAVFDEKKDFRQFAFIELLKAGKSPLKKGARPARLILEEELEQLGNGNANLEALDLTDKKLKEFPRTLTKITSLKKLVLDDNPIECIPDNIKDLVNLEELHLERCGLESLPDEIGMLPKLRVLNVANNSGLVLPESINQLASLRVLNISYNVGFGLPESLTGLKNLEELTCYQCSTAAPIEFPEMITQLTGLKRLRMGSNSIKTIPDSFTNLQHLEELNLNASLCYLNEFPDLSKLKNLKTLHADGLIAFTTRPSSKQSLLKSFFQITSLETLYIDRHGERNEKFIKQDQFAEIQQNLAHDPERFAAFASRLTIVPNIIHGDGRKGIVREALKAGHLEGISNLQNLKVLDLSFNSLTSLPEEIFALKGLQFLNLRYNNLTTSERLTISRNLPGCTIDFRENRVDNDTADSEDVKQWQAMNKRIKEANELMNASGDREKLLKSLEAYDEVLAYFSSGKVVDEYNLLYANYGKVYAYSYLTSNHKASFSPEELLELNQAAINQGLHTLELVPAMIWHFTDLGKFHEEVTRITANSVAWQMHVISDKKENLEKALEIIGKGVAYIEKETHYFIYDTQVRILIKLGRKEEAYKIVKRILTLSPDFGDFQDLKQDVDYTMWLAKQ